MIVNLILIVELLCAFGQNRESTLRSLDGTLFCLPLDQLPWIVFLWAPPAGLFLFSYYFNFKSGLIIATEGYAPSPND